MKFFIIIALTCTFAFAQDHNHHPKQEQQIGKTSSKKFIPSADLKIRMEKISMLSKDLKANKGDQKSLRDSGVKISDVVTDIFKTCKLEPAADEAIHPVLAKILDGTEDLKKVSLKEGDAKIHQGLQEYEKLFQLK